MAQQTPTRDDDSNNSTLRRPVHLNFTSNALHTLDARGLKTEDVRRALEDDPALRVNFDEISGNTVYISGGLAIVTKQNIDDNLVLMVINTDEFVI